MYIYLYGQDWGSAFWLRRASALVFYAFWDVGGMAEWLTRFVSKTQNPKS